MKNYLLIITLFIVPALSFGQVKKPAVQSSAPAASSGRSISVTLTPYKNCWIYLGSYYGNGKILSDSTRLDDKSQGVFKSATKVPGGIYFLVSPQLTIQNEFLIGSVQHFSIVGDSTKKEAAAITGSPDNDQFKEYSKMANEKGGRLANLNQQFNFAKTGADSARLKAEIKVATKDLVDYRESIIKKYPRTLLATLLNAMKSPEVPAIPIVKGKPDSLYPYRFVKDHYWDDVAFNDDRLLRTPFFEKKIDEYFKYYVSPEADSVIAEVKYMLLSARTGKEMYPYLLTKFTNKYLNPEYMGQDKVFIYLFENFYAKGDTTFLNATSRKMIFDRAYSMMANQLGNQAPVLDMIDTTGKTVSLYTVQSPFTFVVFWDPTCGHCKEELPRVDSMYKAKWKAEGVKLYSVNVSSADKTMEELNRFVTEKKFSKDWLYTYQSKAAHDAEQAAGQPNFRQLYDVFQTPTMYLLDDKKRIIAKKLSLEQFDSMITEKLKKQTGKN